MEKDALSDERNNIPADRADRTTLQGVSFLLQVIAIIAVVELALMLGFWAAPIEFPVLVEAAIDAAVLAGISGPIIWRTLVKPLQRSVISEFERAEGANEGLVVEIADRDSRDETQRALDMADTNDAVFDVVRRSLHQSYNSNRHEILVVPGGDADFSRNNDSASADAWCAVQHPQHCPVIRTGASKVFSSSEDVDSCPHFRGQDDNACSGTCVPIRSLGTSVAVVHFTGLVTQPPPTKSLEAIATMAGQRLDLVQALATADRLAQIDPLTGVLNRRALDNAIARHDLAYSVLALDLDDFKKINDEHGHGVGDDALKLFAEVLTSVVRPQDLVARLGGEEFLCVLKDLDDVGAVTVADRIQGALTQVLRDCDTPAFTTSVGIASSRAAESPANVIARADAALYLAKTNGKNRAERAIETVG